MSEKQRKPKVPLALRILQVSFTSLGSIFPKLMGGLAYRLWFIPGRFRTPRREKTIADYAKKSTLDVNGLPVRIWSWGEGPIVLFLHGWAGRGTQVGSFVESLSKKGFRVVGFDGPAHGETPGKKTDILEFAKVTRAVMSHLAPIQGIITHSFGAMIFTLAYHENVHINGAVFISPPATADTLINNFKRILHIPNKAVDVYTHKIKKNYGEDVFDRISVLGNINKIKLPGLIIHDEQDDDVPWQDGERIARTWNNSKFIKTKKLGHTKILYDDKVIRAVTEFLSRLR